MTDPKNEGVVEETKLDNLTPDALTEMSTGKGEDEADG